MKYTDDVPTVNPAEGEYAVCNGILEAAGGKVIMLSKETCACPGGKTHLGLSETRAVPLRMLVEGEKLQGIADAIDKSTAGTAAPSEQFERLVSRIGVVKMRAE